MELTRKQVLQLAEIANKFSDTEWFWIETDDSSGIGLRIYLRFNTFKVSDRNLQDTTIDITDYSTW